MGKPRQRPVDPGIFHSRLPIGAWVSILHRISGVILVLSFPFAFYAFQRSLEPDGFQEMSSMLATTPLRMVLLLIVWALAHHFFAGIRHLLLDIDVGIERAQARASAYAVLGAAGLTVLTAALVWL